LCADHTIDEDGVHAPGLVAGGADLAGVVGDHEGADHPVTGSDSRDLLAHLLHHTDVLVTHQLAIRGVRAAIGPQVGAADAGGHDPDHRIGRVLDPRILPLLDPHITGSMHHNTAHRSSSPGLVAALAAWAAVRGTATCRRVP